uniref:Uncharacterized protein n=1 Tax=Arundo donax TaxID=35708 RepID=A0A0A8ZZN0_ARUDO
MHPSSIPCSSGWHNPAECSVDTKHQIKHIIKRV